MMRKTTWKKALNIFVCGMLGATILIAGCGDSKTSAAVAEKPAAKQEQQLSPARNTPIVQAAKRVGPSVVGIATKAIKREVVPDLADLFPGFPFSNLPGFGGGRRVQERVVEGVGSGVIYDAKKGYIATNNHVVAGAKEITVYLTDGRNVKGKVLGTDPATDLAVVKIDAKNLPEAPMGDSDTIQVGEPAIAIGNPLGMELRGSVTVGIVSALNRQITVGDNKYTLIQTDAAINPGNSGGALVNADGELMGINSAKYAGNGVEGIGFAIPINTAKPILQTLVEKGFVARPYLGISIIDSEALAKSSNGNKDNVGIDLHGGVYINNMYRECPAYKAGVRPGDIIIKINGKKVTTSKEVSQMVKDSKVGDSMVLTLRRGDAEIERTAVLDAIPDELNK